MNKPASRTYYPPPDDYPAPKLCVLCADAIYYAPVVAGNLWRHVTKPHDEHRPLLPHHWWDTASGLRRAPDDLGTVNGKPFHRLDNPNANAQQDGVS